MSTSLVRQAPSERSAADGALERLWERPLPARGRRRGHGMPPQLERRYGGRLALALRNDRPLVIANFVSTVDGVVAFGTEELGGGRLISGHDDTDRFVMGLLRAIADVVVVGAGTLRRSGTQRWTAGHVHPRSAADYARWRESMDLVPNPTTVIVSASGDVPGRHPALSDPDTPAVIATTKQGAERARRSDLAEHVRVESIGDGRALTGEDIIAVVACLGARVVLTEGGPHLLGQLVASDVLDELFLTVAPQIAGRGNARLGLVEGVGLLPIDARWHDLASVSRAGEHLFLRYHRRPTSRTQGVAS